MRSIGKELGLDTERLGLVGSDDGFGGLVLGRSSGLGLRSVRAQSSHASLTSAAGTAAAADASAATAGSVAAAAVSSVLTIDSAAGATLSSALGASATLDASSGLGASSGLTASIGSTFFSSTGVFASLRLPIRPPMRAERRRPTLACESQCARRRRIPHILGLGLDGERILGGLAGQYSSATAARLGLASGSRLVCCGLGGSYGLLV